MDVYAKILAYNDLSENEMLKLAHQLETKEGQEVFVMLMDIVSMMWVIAAESNEPRSASYSVYDSSENEYYKRLGDFLGNYAQLTKGVEPGKWQKLSEDKQKKIEFAKAYGEDRGGMISTHYAGKQKGKQLGLYANVPGTSIPLLYNGKSQLMFGFVELPSDPKKKTKLFLKAEMTKEAKSIAHAKELGDSFSGKKKTAESRREKDPNFMILDFIFGEVLWGIDINSDAYLKYKTSEGGKGLKDLLASVKDEKQARANQSTYREFKDILEMETDGLITTRSQPKLNVFEQMRKIEEYVRAYRPHKVQALKALKKNLGGDNGIASLTGNEIPEDLERLIQGQ